MFSRYALAACALAVAAVAVYLVATGGIVAFVRSELVGVRSELAFETASNVTAAAFRGDAEELSALFGRELTRGEVEDLNRAVPPSVGGDPRKYEVSLPPDQDPSGSVVTVTVAGPSEGLVTLVDLSWDASAKAWRPVALRSAY